MGVSFINPVLLLGALGVVIPLYVHLRQRQRARRIPFSSLRFLQATDRRTARRHKLVDLIALVVRCLLVVLIALGLSRPVIRPPGSGGPGARSGPTFWAIVLDDSYSMGASAGTLSVFDQARQAIRRLMSLAEPGDEIAVVLTSGRPIPGIAEVSHNAYQISAALDRITPSYGASSVADGIERALALMRESDALDHEMIILSDIQRNSFEEAAKIDPLRLSEHIYFIYLLDVGASEVVNATASDLKIARAGPYPGAPITFRGGARLSRPESEEKTKAPESETSAAVLVNGESIGRKDLVLSGNGQVSLDFQHVLVKPGAYVASFEIGADALEADNRFMAPCDVYEQVSTLLIAESPQERRGWGAEFFLALALSPQDTGTVIGKPPIRLTRLAPESVGALDADAYNVVFCVDPGKMSSAGARSLTEFIRRGGRLVVFAGEESLRADSGFYSNRNLFGWRFDSLWSMESLSANPATVATPDGSHPIFQALMDDPAIDLSSIQVYQYIRVDPASMDADSQVVAGLSDDAPWALEKRLGKGSVLCFTSPPAPEWTNLPTRPLFLPLTHEIVKYALGSAKGRARIERVYRPFQVALSREQGDAPTQATLIAPDGLRKSLPIEKGATNLNVPALERPGEYVLELRYGAEQVSAIRILANVDPREGVLTRASEKDMKQWLPFADRWTRFSDADVLMRNIERKRRGFPLMNIILLTALALFIFESYLVNRWLPRRSEHATDAEDRLSVSRFQFRRQE